MNSRTEAFLLRYGMLNPDFDMLATAKAMRDEMERGLRGQESSYPMIPTWLTVGAKIPEMEPVAVIDAGGTNFRRALVHFENGRCIEQRVQKAGMPGIGKPASWQEFISFTADQIEELMPFTDRIGFCFSYSASITPEIDGKVICIDKEVVIKGCEGQLVGASLCEELARRGYPGKKVVVLNDTAAVQLGGMAKHLNEGYAECFGQVSGTGTNTCCTVRADQLTKLGDAAYDMIVNMESGMYTGMKLGEFDRMLDEKSHNPGQKHFEKMTAGVYLGEVCRLMLRQAAKDGLFSTPCAEKILALHEVVSKDADDWAAGKELDRLQASAEDAELISELADYLFRRSARLMCANLIGMALLTDAGKETPAAIYAEGSLVQRNHEYAPELKRLLQRYLREELKRDVTFIIEEDTTLPGAAAAALLNA